MKLHHLIMSTLGGHIGQLEIDRKREREIEREAGIIHITLVLAQTTVSILEKPHMEVTL